MVYDALAPIYDRIMSHVDYGAWLRLVVRVVEKYLHGKKADILELGAGSGALAELFDGEGFGGYTGSDRSPAMCRVARSRGVPLICADCRAVPIRRTYDLVLFLYDGINYLQNLAEYAALFAEAGRCLKPGGLFLFDITTEANSLRHFSAYLEFEDFGDCAYVRRSYYNKETASQHNDFTIFRRCGPDPVLYEKAVENHVQAVFGAPAIARTVPDALFTIEGIWDGFSFRHYRSHSERIHFLLKKRPS